MNAEQEAMNQIIWDYPIKEVTSFLIGQGYENNEAKEMVQGMLLKRHAIVRRMAVRKLLLGGLVGACSLGVVVRSFLDGDSVSWLAGPKIGFGLGLVILGTLWGFWTAITACFNLARPQRVRGDLNFHGESF